MNEIWKFIDGYDSEYLISNTGKVKSVKKGRERLLRFATINTGYFYVTLSRHGKTVKKTVHRLVAETFIPNPEGKTDINHKNGIKTDNRVENLEWVSHSDNLKHAHSSGLFKNPVYPVPITKSVLQIDPDGNVIASYESVTKASNSTGTPATTICMCCKGKRKTSGGFRWKYKQQVETP